MLSSEILNKCNLHHATAIRLSGGDINECWQLIDNGKGYFLKLNDAARFPLMFEKEAEGLKALEENSHLIIPQVIKPGVAGKQQFLLLDFLQSDDAAQDWNILGERIALLHKKAQKYFGWNNDNFIGSLTQNNEIKSTWAEFYSECRILPLIKILFDKNLIEKKDFIAAENLCRRLADIFPEEAPALLHGDLWSGNFMFTSEGPAVYDPAVYYGHREMDLGMSLLFGGFDQAFYDSYNETYPLENNWKTRIKLTQLYPLLVHSILFEGHYIQSVKTIIKKYS